VAARAHLVVLPIFRFTGEVLSEIARALAEAEYALVVIAEGYEEEARRAAPGGPLSASEYLRRQLEEAGLQDGPRKRVIAEPFSRYIRGVRPAFLDVSAAYLKATLLFAAFDEGRTEIMPYVLAADDVGVRPFAEVEREDRVERAFLPLLDRLGLPKFQALVTERFAAEG
jgi:hypothetical protein